MRWIAFAVLAVLVMPAWVPAPAAATSFQEVPLPEGAGWIALVVEPPSGWGYGDAVVEVEFEYGFPSDVQVWGYSPFSAPYDPFDPRNRPGPTAGWVGGRSSPHARLDVDVGGGLGVGLEHSAATHRTRITHVVNMWNEGIMIFGVGDVKFHAVRVLEGTIRAVDSGDDAHMVLREDLETDREGPFVAFDLHKAGYFAVGDPYEFSYTAPRPFIGYFLVDNVTKPDGTSTAVNGFRPWSGDSNGYEQSSAGTYTAHSAGRDGGSVAMWAVAPRWPTVAPEWLSGGE